MSYSWFITRNSNSIFQRKVSLRLPSGHVEKKEEILVGSLSSAVGGLYALTLKHFTLDGFPSKIQLFAVLRDEGVIFRARTFFKVYKGSFFEPTVLPLNATSFLNSCISPSLLASPTGPTRSHFL